MIERDKLAETVKKLREAQAAGVQGNQLPVRMNIDSEAGTVSAQIGIPAVPGSKDNPFSKPETCRTCTLFKEPGPVWSTGPADAKICIVGEKPGAQEVDYPRFRPDHMEPFVGGTGNVLNAELHNAGIARKSLHIANAVKCMPPGNRTPTYSEIAHCKPFLDIELNLLKPNVTIAMGEVSLNALTGKTGITNRRGVPILGFEGRKIFPTWNPAFVMRAQHNWPFAVHDLVRAAAQGAFPELRTVPFNIVTGSSGETVGPALVSAARARRAATFDFETTGLDPYQDRVLMLGLATGPDEAHVLDWTPGTRECFQALLDDPEIEIVGQNILYFDLPFAEGQGVDITKAWSHVFDTMVAFHLCNASYGNETIKGQRAGRPARGAEKDLTMIASCHTDIEYWKSAQHYGSDLRKVCGTDVIATHRAALDEASGIKRELKQLDMLDLYYKEVLPVHPILHQMHKEGFKVDEDRSLRWSIALEAEAKAMEAKLRKDYDMPFLNLNSSKQMMHLLYEKLKLPPQYADLQGAAARARGKVLTANADAIMALEKLAPENKGLRAVIDVRTLRLLKSTFVDKGLQTGRIHANFGTSKTSTGRFNSWNPNAQNVPEIIRELWIPDDDEHILIAADWSQIEWRLAMVLSGDRTGLELLSSGVDSHRAVAAEALQKPMSEVTSAEREAGKFIAYGLGYGRGADSLSKGSRSQAGGADRGSLSMTPDFVQTFITNFFNRFKDYKHYRDGLATFAARHHYLVNAFKRRRWWHTQSTPTEQYNFPMQSNAADMMYTVMILIHAALPKGASIRLTVHDELVFNVPKDVAKQTLLMVKEIMQQPWPQIVDISANRTNVLKYYPQGWFCPVDAHLGTDWSMCKSKDPVRVAARNELEKFFGVI